MCILYWQRCVKCSACSSCCLLPVPDFSPGEEPKDSLGSSISLCFSVFRDLAGVKISQSSSPLYHCDFFFSSWLCLTSHTLLSSSFLVLSLAPSSCWMSPGINEVIKWQHTHTHRIISITWGDITLTYINFSLTYSNINYGCCLP